MSREQLLLSQLAVIEHVIGWTCARRGLRGADAEDFGSVVKARLVDNDYEILARFEGRSSLKTYLAAVINRIYLDFQVQRFGKWRPSAEARRRGSVALRLERLLFRDGFSFDEACGVLANDPRVRETREALYAMSQALPSRGGRGSRVEGQEPPASETAASPVERAERQALAERTFSAVRRSLGQLPAADRVFFRLHFEQGLTVAEAARCLGREQKGLYHRKEGILERLRADLEAAGIEATDAHELLLTLDWNAALGLEDPQTLSNSERNGSRPSQEHDPVTRWDGEP